MGKTQQQKQDELMNLLRMGSGANSYSGSPDKYIVDIQNVDNVYSAMRNNGTTITWEIPTITGFVTTDTEQDITAKKTWKIEGLEQTGIEVMEKDSPAGYPNSVEIQTGFIKINQVGNWAKISPFKIETQQGYNWIRANFPAQDGTLLTTGYIIDNLTTGRTDRVLSANQGFVINEALNNRYTKAQADNKFAEKATTLSGYGITDAYTKSQTYTKTETNNLFQTFYDGIFPVNSVYFGFQAPGVPSGVNATWTLQTTYNGKALWVDTTKSVGTSITQALPKPTLTFTGSSATTNSTGAHTHTRGTMEITGTMGSICNQNGTATGCFTYTRDNNAELSGSNQSRGTWTFTASNNWTGETSSNGAHTHTVTAKGSVTCNTAGAYGTGSVVQPPAVAISCWKRTA